MAEKHKAELHPLPKRRRPLNPERGKESCLLALSGKVEQTQSLGDEHHSG